MNKKLIFVFAAVMLVPVALLGQEKAAAQSATGCLRRRTRLPGAKKVFTRL